MKATLLALCTSACRGHSKTPIDRGVLRAAHGLVGDVEFMRSRGLPGLHFGSFAENMVIGGLDFGHLGIGSRLRIGCAAEIRITQIGKECHTACAIMARVGECIMPTRGLFAEVVRGGDIAAGDRVEILGTVPRASVPVLEEATT